ncbi:hypothetical protein AWM79_13670 [Pseudomonas agarici]|uniref:Uncharacterized protein n=1 Tax=Pseudomonas agarici TaxID=46677 RepID=A0A0X1T2L7_PSEAA|nr:hypothetical protein [Pseudomonas agarici]AMB86294.1 hypothetical protein AWM79_13670 [Pseudomonas agarici]NWB90333.1 hypothetical protein [Pseudomonas agarici]NWC08768.1 hypothetical protein [Pseudomonas agarici]SEK57134.1 hypothetical protein SAMN05216604_10495 [Pseudomonas agarici]
MDAIDAAALHRQLDLLDGDEEVLKRIRPVISELVRNLEALPCSSFGKGALPMFKRCIVRLNSFEEDIETVERESLLDVIYRLGELVGLTRESEFAEEWRGDW